MMRSHRAVTENEAPGTVSIAGIEIHGFVVEDACGRCGAKLLLDLDHDAHICAQCDVWTEPVCADSDCAFCRDRPVKPLVRSPLFRWAAGDTLPSLVGRWALVATGLIFLGVLPLAWWLRLRWLSAAAWPALTVSVLVYFVCDFVYQIQFDVALANDRLLSESEKRSLRARRMFAPFFRRKLLRRLRQLAGGVGADRPAPS